MAYHSIYGRRLGVDEYGVVKMQNGFSVDDGTKTATAVAGAATLNKASGKITTEALTTAAGANYTLTIANSKVFAVDTVVASVANGTNTAGAPVVISSKAANGSIVVIIKNVDTAAALNGTLIVGFLVIRG